MLQCYKVIYGYMGFAMMNIFFFFTGALVIELLRIIGLHVDLVSLTFILFNFSVRYHVILVPSLSVTAYQYICLLPTMNAPCAYHSGST